MDKKEKFFIPQRPPEQKTLKNIKKFIETGKDNRVFKGEIQKTPKDLERIKEVKECIREWAINDIGIDTEKPFPKTEHIHFVNSINPNKNSRESHRDENLTKTKCTGTQNALYGDIAILKQNPSETFDSLQHEILHNFAQNSIEIIEEDNNITLNAHSSGFQSARQGKVQRGRTLMIVDEALNEMANTEIQKKYWQKKETLKELRTDNSSYLYAVIMFDELFKKMSGNDKKGYLNIVHNLQKGRILGQPQQLRIITDFIGKNNLKKLAHVKSGDSDEIIALCKDLNLESAVKKIKQAQKTGEANQILEAFEI